jgi:hypothetical protein
MVIVITTGSSTGVAVNTAGDLNNDGPSELLIGGNTYCEFIKRKTWGFLIG